MSILEGMRKGKMLVDTYVITLPESGNHILDIRPVSLLRKEERESRELVILGIARGYGEADFRCAILPGYAFCSWLHFHLCTYAPTSA